MQGWFTGIRSLTQADPARDAGATIVGGGSIIDRPGGQTEAYSGFCTSAITKPGTLISRKI